MTTIFVSPSNKPLTSPVGLTVAMLSSWDSHEVISLSSDAVALSWSVPSLSTVASVSVAPLPSVKVKLTTIFSFTVTAQVAVALPYLAVIVHVPAP